ncbi:hypothetical protein FRC09_009315, partial [Ceratobasidium sp. 395]
MTVSDSSSPTESSAPFALAQLTDRRPSPQPNDADKPTSDVEIASLAPPEYDPNLHHRAESDFAEGGVEGWVVVVGCTLVLFSTIGWNLIWGVFEIYHADHTLKGASDAQLSAVGAVQNS